MEQKYPNLHSCQLNIAMAYAQALATEALAAFPAEAQSQMAIEEMGELMTAMARMGRGRSTSADVVDEAADVLVMALQMGLMHGGAAGLEQALSYKLDRLHDRLTRVRAPK